MSSPKSNRSSETRALNELGAGDVARGIAAGAFTAEAVVLSCLARIEEREPTVQAWAFLDPALALSQARERDAMRPFGPLHGVPIGVKDIIATADMPTEMGSPIYKGHRPPNDAACVALVRAAGAVILGKTVTAEFAGQAPGATTNPHDPTRTPGGSSSGSGAAVADFMAAGAFGTQTGGSVIRPSAYCGIVGFKPSFGTFNLGGVKPAAEALDTLGIHTRSLEDAKLLTDVLVGRPATPIADRGGPPRIGLCRTYEWTNAEPETVQAVEDASARLAAAGAQVREVGLPDGFARLGEVREIYNAYQRARLMAHEWTHHRDLISDRLRAALAQGWEMPYERYIDAVRFLHECHGRFGAVFDGLDALLTPAADGEAPEGLDFTGSHRFQSIWTMLHVPSICLPTHRGPTGLPVAIQLVGPWREDDQLLSVARWVWDRLGRNDDG